MSLDGRGASDRTKASEHNSVLSRVILVRHGQTAWNAESRFQGQCDVPLSSVGRDQAQAIASASMTEDVSAIYSSDLVRAIETARPTSCLLKLPIKPDERLRERKFGCFEKLLVSEALEKYPLEFERYKRRDVDCDLRGGESLKAFFCRAIDAIGLIARKHQNETVVIFTHGGLLDATYRHAKNIDLAAPRTFPIENASVSRLEISESDWRIVDWCDTRHLTGPDHGTRLG